MDEPTVRTDGGGHTDGEDGGTGADGVTEPNGELSLEELLLSDGILEETHDGTDVRLTDEFERAWHRRIEQMRGGDRAIRWLAASRGVGPDEITVSDDDERFVVTHDGSTVGAWHSEAAFLAGIVAEPTVKEFLPAERLDRLSDDARRELGARLRMCLERCPTCGAELAFSEEHGPEGGVEVSLDCPDCGATVAGGSYE